MGMDKKTNSLEDADLYITTLCQITSFKAKVKKCKRSLNLSIDQVNLGKCHFVLSPNCSASVQFKKIWNITSLAPQNVTQLVYRLLHACHSNYIRFTT